MQKQCGIDSALPRSHKLAASWQFILAEAQDITPTCVNNSYDSRDLSDRSRSDKSNLVNVGGLDSRNF